MTLLLTAVATAAITIGQVQAHGFMKIPLAKFKKDSGSPSEWIVEIQPQWKGDWDAAKGDEGLVEIYKTLKVSNGVSDIRTMIDGDANLFGADCGKTDPNAAPETPPTMDNATFSRGIVHAGPCEIWLDDKLVLTNDDCQSAYGDGTQETISVFKPIDYSSCSSSGCMFRFYWLAFQRRDSKTIWQVYKNCVPLSGPVNGGDASTSKTSSYGKPDPPIDKSDLPSSKEYKLTDTDIKTDTHPSLEIPSPSSQKCTRRR
ncbi:hypothetical protein CCR75_006008 [Bremia lactucae]|uniref:Secreted protein n=1 Tax=Bremia lactucae TaxID=4779 RepID=A0A976FIV8_BRELC|nr:hypothetical protein CCR75_006008 [Bremia lactucae]